MPPAASESQAAVLLVRSDVRTHPLGIHSQELHFAEVTQHLVLSGTNSCAPMMPSPRYHIPSHRPGTWSKAIWAKGPGGGP